MTSYRSTAYVRRRFRVKHALRSVDDASALLEPAPAVGIEIASLERVREDLALVLRISEAEAEAA